MPVHDLFLLQSKVCNKTRMGKGNCGLYFILFFFNRSKNQIFLTLKVLDCLQILSKGFIEIYKMPEMQAVLVLIQLQKIFEIYSASIHTYIEYLQSNIWLNLVQSSSYDKHNQWYSKHGQMKYSIASPKRQMAISIDKNKSKQSSRHGQQNLGNCKFVRKYTVNCAVDARQRVAIIYC